MIIFVNKSFIEVTKSVNYGVRRFSVDHTTSAIASFSSWLNWIYHLAFYLEMIDVTVKFALL